MENKVLKANCDRRFTLESQLLYRMGLLRAFSLSMLGKCLRATMSMFSSVHLLSSSPTSLKWNLSHLKSLFDLSKK